MKKLLLINFLIIHFSAALAQIDSSIYLNEVNISSTRLNNYNDGLHKYTFDSLLTKQYQHLSLSDLLDENTSVYLKNYGPGELSTTSLRGGSSYQTSVLWNGLAINSALNGLTDLSMEKNFFFDDISIQYGGTSSIWGSGAVSGSIHLCNSPLFNKGLIVTAGLTAGSFSNYIQYAGIGYGSKIFSGSLKFIHEDNKNNFNYYNANTGSEEQQVNSAIKHYGILSENYLMTGRNSILNFRIWYTFFDRQIPPSLYQVNPNAIQTDKNNRISIEWKTAGEKYEFAVRSAYFSEKEKYDDDYLYAPSQNNCRTLISEATFEYRLKKNHTVQAGLNENYSATDSSQNFNAIDLSRFSIFALYNFQSHNTKFGFSLSARKEFSSLNNSPLVYSGGINYKPTTGTLLRFSVSKVHRNPTLNDLYWQPGGDKNLKPETGYTTEAGIHNDLIELINQNKNQTPSSAFIDATYYYKIIDDWIIWYPSQSYIWRPQNLLRVKSHGIELSIGYKYSKNSFSAGIETNYYYTISTNEKSLHTNDASLDKQLIYVPVVKWNSHLYMIYRSWGIHFNHSYTGKRYTASDNSEFLDPYSIGNITIDKSVSINTSFIRFFFTVNNLSNTGYESVMSRPMPLRSFIGGISFTFQKNKNK